MNLRRMRWSSRVAEEGYVLAAVIIMLAVLMIFLAAAVPKVKEDIRRDQEIETMHRGKQYARAIQLYYRKFRKYPANIDALEDSNMQRFLRKRYLDPLTGKDDWVPVLLGQNKAPLTMGYFGQPLTMGAAVLTNPAANQGGSNSGSNNIVGASPLPSAFGPNSSNGLPTSSGMPIVGGGGIIGFSPAPDKDSILIYKTKSHYTQWEFVYDPAADRGYAILPFPIAPSGPPTNSGAPGFGTPTSGVYGAPTPPPTPNPQ